MGGNLFMGQISVIMIGAGDRGTTYARSMKAIQWSNETMYLSKVLERGTPFPTSTAC